MIYYLSHKVQYIYYIIVMMLLNMQLMKDLSKVFDKVTFIVCCFFVFTPNVEGFVFNSNVVGRLSVFRLTTKYKFG